jgi:hypothetical protein
MQAGEKRGGIDEARSSEVRWEERIEGAEMSGGEDMGIEEVDSRHRQRWPTKYFFFFSFFVFPFSFSFAKYLLYAEETKVGKYVKLDGEGRRKEGNDPAW